eukprot:gene6660-6884_t
MTASNSGRRLPAVQKQSEAGQAVHVTVVDAVGIGAGGSGAAAGLLHPYTPKGKLLWRAQEALAAALDLLAVAEAAAAAKDASKATAAVDVGCNAGGITVQPLLYMQALWEACLQEAGARDDGSSAQLHIQQLTSLHQLQDVQCIKDNNSSSVQQPHFDAIVVAAGAAVGSLVEIGPDSLPLSLCQGYTLDLGGRLLVVGATKQHNWTTQQALAELGRTVAGIRSGVRALAPRTPQGALPVAGRWTAPSQAQQQQQQEEEEEEDNEQDKEEGECKPSGITYRSHPHLARQGPALPPVWLLVGLGARGFVYHAWLGKVLAAAVIHEDESLLPPELLGWKTNTSSSSAAANMA